MSEEYEALRLWKQFGKDPGRQLFDNYFHTPNTSKHREITHKLFARWLPRLFHIDHWTWTCKTNNNERCDAILV